MCRCRTCCGDQKMVTKMFHNMNGTLQMQSIALWDQHCSRTTHPNSSFESVWLLSHPFTLTHLFLLLNHFISGNIHFMQLCFLYSFKSRCQIILCFCSKNHRCYFIIDDSIGPTFVKMPLHCSITVSAPTPVY